MEGADLLKCQLCVPNKDLTCTAWCSAPIIDADLYDEVVASEAVWELDGCIVEVHLDKARETWWKTAVLGEHAGKPVDTKKVCG